MPRCERSDQIAPPSYYIVVFISRAAVDLRSDKFLGVMRVFTWAVRHCTSYGSIDGRETRYALEHEILDTRTVNDED